VQPRVDEQKGPTQPEAVTLMDFLANVMGIRQKDHNG
jgi:hypothetical protein